MYRFPKAFLIINLLVLVLSSPSLAYSQEPIPTVPKALITGPTNNIVDKPNQAIIIRTKGSVGDHFKFSLAPSVNQSFTVKDESGELIFLFVPEVPGVYSVAFAAGSKAVGLVDVKILQIIVNNGNVPIPKPIDPIPKPIDPKPIPIPIPTPVDELTDTLTKAYALDVSLGSTVNHKKILASLYINAAKKTTYDPKVTRSSQVYDVMRAALADPTLKAEFPPTALANVRTAISTYQTNVLGKGVLAFEGINPSNPMPTPNRDKIAATLLKIGTTLDSIP